MMPVLLFWAVPAATIVASYYFVTAATFALAIPTEMPSDRRRNFKVIQGGRA
jgi:hypothetical protein